MFLVVLEQGVRELEDPDHAFVGDPVVDGAVLLACLDEAAPAQAGEVIGHLGLRDPEPFDELTDRELAVLLQQIQDPQPRRVAQAAEVLGDEVGLGRGLGKTEGRGLGNSCLPPLISEAIRVNLSQTDNAAQHGRQAVHPVGVAPSDAAAPRMR